MKNERTGYTFMKQWFDFAYQNPDKVAPIHAALYFWLIQLNNTLNWKEKFGVPTFHAMEVLGIKNYRTYKRAFDDLQNWNFIQLHERSTNQHTANVVALVKFTQADTKASPKQVQSTATIDKPIETTETKKTLETSKGDSLPFKIFNLFLEAHGNYTVIDEKQLEEELRAAQTLLTAFQKETPGLTEEDTLEYFRQFFINTCINTPDNWLRPQLSLPIIVKHFNRLKNSASGPYSKKRNNNEVTMEWIQNIANKWFPPNQHTGSEC